MKKIISTDFAPAAIGPYSQAILIYNTLYVSGQIGTLSDGNVIEGGIEAETIQSLENIEAVLKRLGGSKDDVFKCTCMLKDIKDWPAMSKHSMTSG